MPQFIKCLAIAACFVWFFFPTNYPFLNMAAHESNVLNHFSTVKTWAGFFVLIFDHI